MSILCAGLIACSSSDQEDVGVIPNSESQEMEIASDNNDISLANPFSKAAEPLNSYTQSMHRDGMVETALDGAAHETVIHLAGKS